MIISGLATVFLSIIDKLFVFSLPSIPAVANDAITYAVGLVTDGIGILRALLGQTTLNGLAAMLGLVLAAHGIYLFWDVIQWILRKIPMLGMGK